ncbi:uncharacterized protein LOC123015468 [Tribolium madens]|uniref:uncharacterized protein LOC123015468 n=1 Tax=Tribolium madens TaxID=41895 RepID=UPI001CF75BA3|nr:uncharacterized protein LOC123015468 [Tribolium madens]
MNNIPGLNAGAPIPRREETHYVCSNCRANIPNTIVDYYWRDYTGVVPPDAIIGGNDINGRPTYIGQGFYSKAGLLPGTIYPGKSEIKLPYNGLVLSTIGVKILCSGNPNNFSWERAESTSLHVTTIGKHLVIGGFEDGKYINIGRAMYQGELIVGKVLGFDPEKARLCFIHEEKEIVVNSYQILVYNN